MDGAPKPPAEKLMELLAGGGEKKPGGKYDAEKSVAAISALILIHTVEAIAGMAVHNGMPWSESYALSIKTMNAAAAFLLESGMHPAQLKDMICQPGSMAIRGLSALESEHLRGLLMRACLRVYERIQAPDPAGAGE